MSYGETCQDGGDCTEVADVPCENKNTIVQSDSNQNKNNNIETAPALCGGDDVPLVSVGPEKPNNNIIGIAGEVDELPVVLLGDCCFELCTETGTSAAADTNAPDSSDLPGSSSQGRLPAAEAKAKAASSRRKRGARPYPFASN